MLTIRQQRALGDLVNHGEMLCFEGARWSWPGFERDPSKLPEIVPLVWYETITIRALVGLGFAELGTGFRRVKPTEAGRNEVVT
jgi:hypothetical protein